MIKASGHGLDAAPARARISGFRSGQEPLHLEINPIHSKDAGALELPRLPDLQSSEVGTLDTAQAQASRLPAQSRFQSRSRNRPDPWPPPSRAQSSARFTRKTFERTRTSRAKRPSTSTVQSVFTWYRPTGNWHLMGNVHQSRSSRSGRRASGR